MKCQTLSMCKERWAKTLSLFPQGSVYWEKKCEDIEVEVTNKETTAAVISRNMLLRHTKVTHRDRRQLTSASVKKRKIN